jgi:hypothetical protein
MEAGLAMRLGVAADMHTEAAVCLVCFHDARGFHMWEK